MEKGCSWTRVDLPMITCIALYVCALSRECVCMCVHVCVNRTYILRTALTLLAPYICTGFVIDVVAHMSECAYVCACLQ